MQTPSDTIKNEILSAARDQFLNYGYGATTVDAVATQARVTNQTVQQFFPDKNALFKGVLEETVGEPWEYRNLLDNFKTTEDLRHILIQIATSLNEIITQPDYVRLLRLVISEIPTQPDLIPLVERGATRRVYNATLVVLRTATARDLIAFQDIDTAANRFIGGLLVPVYYDGLLKAEPKIRKLSTQKIIRYVEDFIRNAILTKQAEKDGQTS